MGIISTEQPPPAEISESKREVRFFSMGVQEASWRLVEGSQSQQVFGVPCFCFAYYGEPTQGLETFRHLSSAEGIANGGQTNFFLYTHAEVTSHLLKHRDQMRLFHFAGGTIAPSEQEELATLLGICPNLRLVFWEVPTTDKETTLFLSKGAAALISGQGLFEAGYAANFAERFYQSFARHNSKMTLNQAFDAATYFMMEEYDSAPKLRSKQALKPSYGEQAGYDQAPLFKLSLRSGANGIGEERFADWVSTSDAVFSKKWREHTRQLIADGKLREALVRLAAADTRGEMLLAWYEKAQKNCLHGIIDNEDWFIQQARITQDALILLDSAAEPRQTYA